ncbi:hypothetical protein LR48_Vigan09g104300 [Vigna angularis]|uniref:Ubiquitinyl hydrolase 1 n=1 Tax=Phaseolus angularis TaxID=3914 RepID=A0A0L9VCK6_PHAAN|nr:hypothetical protein LR48_Vigan09g104300 [Vigna angularis]
MSPQHPMVAQPAPSLLQLRQPPSTSSLASNCNTKPTQKNQERKKPSLHRTSRRAGPSAQSKVSPATPFATGAIVGRDVDFSLFAFSSCAREKLSRSSANRRLREPSLREPQTRMQDEVMTDPISDAPEMEGIVSDVPEVEGVVSDAPEMEESWSSAESQTMDSLSSGRFTWTIKNFSTLTKKIYSEVFYVGGHKWKILLFPKGNSVDHLSLYLDVADSMMLAPGWSRFAQFCLTVVNQFNTQYSFRKESQHLFNARESDWGFTNFMPLAELCDPSRGYCVNDTCIVEADVAIRKVLDYWSHDSKKETGYVGLKNQGATCYMNSLLQTLYHIPYFRKHDVQELNRVLCEKLENKMKGTVVEGTIQKLFEGHHMNYIDCINVDYKSMREESFYDLQLDVKGCQNVYDSFDKYVEVEQLEGDNKYHAEWHGLQEARKGVLFVDFPPVLQLQLKRFEYDFMRDSMVKVSNK